MESSTANLSMAPPVPTVTCPRIAATSSRFWFEERSFRPALSELGSPLSTRSHGCRRTVVGHRGAAGGRGWSAEGEAVRLYARVEKLDLEEAVGDRSGL